ncbi:recombinase family protein [Streptomyces griseobrunneus]
MGRQHQNHIDPAASALGWAVVARYTDNHLTAADPDIIRPAFQNLVRDLRARQTANGYRIVGLIAVEDERVYRLPEDYLRLYRALTVDDAGCLYYTDKKHLVDVHAESEQTRGLVMSSVGEGEVRRVKRRITRNSKDRALEGKVHGSSLRRFGWNATVKDSRGNVIKSANETLDPKESSILRRLIDMRLKGKGWNNLAVWLIENSVATVRGGKWTGQGVKVMLVNPAMFGGRMINGELLCDEEGNPVIGQWETLATYEEWLKLYLSAYPTRDPRNAETKKKGAKRARKHLASTITRCGWIKEGGDEMCLHGMVGRPPHGAHKWGNYVCNAADCRKVSRRMDKIDAVVAGVVTKVLERQFAAIAPESRPWHGEETLKSLQKRKADLMGAYKSGAVDIGEYIEMRDGLDVQITACRVDRDEYYEQQAAKNFLAGFTRERWGEFDLHQRVKAVETVLQAVIIHPIPVGRSRRAPFDPDLIQLVFRETN